MANIAIKGLATLATAGAIGGVAYGVNVLNNTTDTVHNYLLKKGFKIRAEGWENVLKTYKLEKAGFEIDSTVSEGDNIKNWCTKNLTKKVESADDSLFQKASKWCVEYETIADKLKGKKFEEEASKLKNKLSSFTTEIQAEINKIGGKSEDNQEGEKIKQWCEDNKYRRYSDNNYYKEINKNCLTAT